MKIAFDENVPVGVAKVFQTLAAERKMRRSIAAPNSEGELIIVSAKDYAPTPGEEDYIQGSDAPWLERFAKEGGQAVISGDIRMLSVPHELLAIRQLGLVVVLCDAKWNKWDFFQKSALLLWHWNAIILSIRSAKPASIFRIPTEWSKKKRLRPLTKQSGPVVKMSRRMKKAVSDRAIGRKRAKQRPPSAEGVQTELDI